MSSLLAAAFLLGMVLSASLALGMQRDEFAKVLKLMPPNGPLWQYGTVVMQGRTRQAGMAPVVFAHWSHRSRYTCRVCHQELGFSMRKGDSGINRQEIVAGKLCGACHNGSIAFSVKDEKRGTCKKCHMENTDALETQFSEFSHFLPVAPFGNGIDWAAALNEGMVTPENRLGGGVAFQFPEKLKQPLKLGTTSQRSDVTFSHRDHFAELDCSSCHPDIFSIKRKATTSFSMESNIYGSYCGVCHMLVAFPMNDCKRCHHSMQNGGY